MCRLYCTGCAECFLRGGIMPATIRPASLLFNRILRYTLGTWVTHRFDARFDADVLRDLKPPYLIIGNHTCFFDPFLLSIPVGRPVHFVSSDEYFRTPFMRFVFSLIGGIPKTKNTRDTQAVRTMLNLKNAGAVLGVYPEGNRNWDGVTGPLFGSTAKLIRKLAIPVVSVQATGGTLTQPRWGRHWRNGWMKLTYRILFTPEDCRALAETEILERMIASLSHDDMEAVVETAAADHLPLRFSGRRLAERLELFLFQCPQCGSLDTLVSREDHFFCTVCTLSLRFGEDGRFHAPAQPLPEAALHTGLPKEEAPPGEPQTPDPHQLPLLPSEQWTVPGVLPFTTTRDWNRWQLELLFHGMQEGAADPEHPLLRNEGALLETGGRSGRLVRQGRGTVTLFPNRLRFDAMEPGTMPISLPIADLTGLNIQYNNRFELYRDGTLFRFSFPDAFLSVWKWHQALLYAGVPGADAGDATPTLTGGTHR